MDRVKTGIPGFDELVEGGLPRGSNTLIAGTPGTGKTIFGIQYLYNGAQNGENGIYVSLDTTRKEIINQAKDFGLDLESLEKSDKIIILEVPLDKTEVNIFSMIEDAVQKIKAKRLVFDSLINFAINIDQFVIPLNYQLNPTVASAFGNSDSKGRIFYEGKSEKRVTYLLINELSRLETTNLIITAGTESKEQITVDGVSEYACDGVIEVYNELIGAKRVRTMTILKLRNTDHSQYVHEIELTKKGMIVKPAEVVYS